MTKQSHIEQLIHDLCPNGVEIKTLGELVDCVKGKQLNRSDLLSAGYPVLNGGTTYSGYWTEYNFPGNNITISQGGASAGFVSFQEGKFWAGAHCYVLINPHPNVNYKYLYHIVKYSEETLRQNQYGAGIPGLAVQTVNSILVPLPPLTIQNKIAQILDTFSKLTDNLDTEIKERERQSLLYRNHIFNYGVESGVELKTLEQIVSKDCPLSYGIVQPGDDVKNGVPVVRPVDFAGRLYIKREGLKRTTKSISDSYKRTILNGDEILICVRGTTGTMGLATKELKGCNVTRGIVPISFDNEITKKFVFHQLRSSRLKNAIEEKTNGTALRQINIKDLRQLPIYLPSLKEQQAIAAKLDTIEAFIANLNEERTLRQQQYEYYRAKLISLLK